MFMFMGPRSDWRTLPLWMRWTIVGMSVWWPPCSLWNPSKLISSSSSRMSPGKVLRRERREDRLEREARRARREASRWRREGREMWGILAGAVVLSLHCGYL